MRIRISVHTGPFDGPELVAEHELRRDTAGRAKRAARPSEQHGGIGQADLDRLGGCATGTVTLGADCARPGLQSDAACRRGRHLFADVLALRPHRFAVTEKVCRTFRLAAG